MNALFKYFNPYYSDSFNQRFREKRFNFFLSLLDKISSDKTIQILDVGGTEHFWTSMKFPEKNNVFITLLNLEAVETTQKNLQSVKGDACNLSEYQNNQFDIVFSNSVIEHLFNFENQKKMADEVMRVGKNYYVQTPNYYFPLEAHWVFPFFQFLPFHVRVFFTHHFNIGHIKKNKHQ
jgi:trans-aconitate methyltransferase